MKYFIFVILSLILVGCDRPLSSDKIQQVAQEKLLMEATAKTGMPNIINNRERKLMKDIIEMRDQDGLFTYTYLYAEQSGKLIFACDSIGYGLPAATQYTNPEKVVRDSGQSFGTIPQADPNGLFSPSSAEGTWVLCKDPNGTETRPVYFEPRIVVSPFPLVSLK